MIRCLLTFLLFSSLLFAQTADPADLEKGVNFFETKTYSAEENAELLKLYEKLRVADVSDGLDMVGLPNTGLVDASIQACWKDEENLSHVFRGIALTCRYVPTQKKDRPEPGEDFAAWEGHFYSQYSAEPWASIIQPGHVIVIDDDEFGDVGTIGSNNVMGWAAKGAVGVVTDAGARDADEVAIEKVPLYLRKKSRGIRPGRNELESVNHPVSIGGVLVCPGDVVVADGDGVVVVPRYVAEEVAKNAQQILDNDKAGRRNLYKQLGLPPDQTVE
jgi:regulator of RNase E activity RraA